MKSPHQTRENLRLIDNALCELSEFSSFDTTYYSQFHEIFEELISLYKKVSLELKELEEQCLENMKS